MLVIKAKISPSATFTIPPNITIQSQISSQLHGVWQLWRQNWIDNWKEAASLSIKWEIMKFGNFSNVCCPRVLVYLLVNLQSHMQVPVLFDAFETHHGFSHLYQIQSIILGNLNPTHIHRKILECWQQFFFFYFSEGARISFDMKGYFWLVLLLE